MPISSCDHCGGDYAWNWTEAFNKFGFDDGDGQIMTDEVADILRNAGYEVVTKMWGLHNSVVVSIKQDDQEFIQFDDTHFGYDEPRNYLPKTVIEILDRELPDAH